MCGCAFLFAICLVSSRLVSVSFYLSAVFRIPVARPTGSRLPLLLFLAEWEMVYKFRARWQTSSFTFYDIMRS